MDDHQTIKQLYELTEKINSGFTLDEILNHIFDSFRSVIPYNRIGFALIEKDGKIVREHWARSDNGEAKVSGYYAKLEGSSLKKIVETGKPRILNDLESYLEEHPDSRSTRRIVSEGMRSSLTCPLIVFGKPVGFVFFSSTKKDTYRDVHVDVFLKIAKQLSFIVEKSRLYERLKELNELKSEFLGMAAHDLRNPIGVIKSYSELFLSGYVGEIDDKQRRILQNIYKNCENMINLVEDLLDVTAIQTGKLKLDRKEVDINQFLSNVYANAQIWAQAKSIDVNLNLSSELPTISFDPNRIEQVVNNLITNAIKFSYSETTVTMSAAETEDFVEISVEDEGQGIPEEDIKKIFNEFGRARVRPTAGEKSTGLGLAIAKKIVEAHGGKIWVKSQVDVGSKFTFNLPKQIEK